MPAAVQLVELQHSRLTCIWRLDAALAAVLLDIGTIVLEGRNCRCSSIYSGTSRDGMSMTAPRNAVSGFRCF